MQQKAQLARITEETLQTTTEFSTTMNRETNRLSPRRQEDLHRYQVMQTMNSD